jgi:capsular exopolysaccharide synthesis family protein
MITSSLRAATTAGGDSSRVLKLEVQSHYRTLLQAIGNSLRAGGEPIRVIGITSTMRGEGVSTVATHLALTAASQRGRGVLLADFHLAWPSLFRRLAVQAAPGLSEVIVDSIPVQDVIQSGPLPNLSVLSAGARNGNPEVVYEAEELADLMELLKDTYDLVVLDLPPMDETAGALALPRLCDGILLVVEAERVRLDAALHAKHLLHRARGQLLGTVMTKHRRWLPRWL